MGQKIAGCLGTLVSLLLVAVWVHAKWESHVEDTGIEMIAKGNDLMKAGDAASLQQAADEYKKAAKVFHDLGSKERRNEGLAYYNLARANHAQKQDMPALDAGQKAVVLLDGDDAKEDRAQALGNIGLYCVETKQLENGFDSYTRAAELYQQIGKPDRAKSMINVKAAIRYDQTTEAIRAKEWPKARDLAGQSQELYHGAGNRKDEAKAFHRLYLIYEVIGETEKSMEAARKEKELGGSPAAAPADSAGN
jgi:tetratricopeptide (TPR) repeat protein